LALAPFLKTARAVMEPLGCDAVLRAFHPVSVPALHLDDRGTRHEQARASEQEAADGLWAGILGSLRGTAPRARLVLNHLNPLIQRMAAVEDPRLAGTALEALYGQALLMAQRPLRPADSALLNRTFLGLLDWAVHPSDTTHTCDTAHHSDTAHTCDTAHTSDTKTDTPPGHAIAPDDAKTEPEEGR
jgi:molecular chaperone HtpG